MPPRASTPRPTRRPRGGAGLRRQLVEQLEESGCLTSGTVRSAFLAVPRERFLSEISEREGLERVYRNEPIVTAKDERGFATSSSSQPSMMASMLEQLDLRPGHRVLEVGAGTGYNAALLAEIVGARGQVVSVELDPATARGARRALAGVSSRARVVRGDGRAGWPRAAPYDRVIVTASAQAVPAAWHEQLVDGGLLELPLVLREAIGFQAILTLRKEGDALRSQALLHGGFMPLRDAPGAPGPPSPPSLSAGERVDNRSRPLAYLSGAALGRLSTARRRRLLALALSEPRTHELGLRAPRGTLSFYLTVEGPGDRLVGGSRLGVISENGEGLAFLEGGPKTVTRVESYGDRAAERLLVGLAERWKRAGRPTARDLQVEMGFHGEATPEIRSRWSA